MPTIQELLAKLVTLSGPCPDICDGTIPLGGSGGTQVVDIRTGIPVNPYPIIKGESTLIALILTFNDITNANTLVGDASNVDDWNTFFDLPNYGNPFTSVVINGNEVQLFGGSNIEVKIELFAENQNLVSVNDTANSITVLGESCFGGCSILESVYLGGCITTIYTGENLDYGTFGSSYNLTTVSLPVVINIAEYTFYDTPLLTTININPSITVLGDYVFSSAYGLVSISLDNVTTAGVNCFVNCTSLTTLSLPKLTTAGFGCFVNCTSLTTISLPNLTSAGDYCFQLCSSVTTISLPKLTSTGDYVFYQCTSLTTINLPNLTSAGNHCFFGDTSVTTISLPKLTTAGNYCFYANTSVTTISLPKLTTAGNYCFYANTSLTTINLPNLTSAGNYCFVLCDNLTTINLFSCQNLGSTVGDNGVFTFISGSIITLTIPSALMTCNGGNPDGDIITLASNNAIIVNGVPYP